MGMLKNTCFTYLFLFLSMSAEARASESWADRSEPPPDRAAGAGDPAGFRATGTTPADAVLGMLASLLLGPVMPLRSPVLD